MWQILSLLSIGFLFGLKHAFDADHIAAMAVFSSNSGNIKKAALRGMYWGLGHTIALASVAAIVLIFHTQISPSIERLFELGVGAMLIVVGIKTFFGNAHAHDHFPYGKHIHPSPSFITGLIHGLAGSAALMLLIVAAIDSVFLAIGYILIFSLGSICGMVLFVSAIGVFASHPRFSKYFTTAAGMISLVVGLHVIWEQAS